MITLDAEQLSYVCGGGALGFMTRLGLGGARAYDAGQKIGTNLPDYYLRNRHEGEGPSTAAFHAALRTAYDLSPISDLVDARNALRCARLKNKGITSATCQ